MGHKRKNPDLKRIGGLQKMQRDFLKYWALAGFDEKKGQECAVLAGYAIKGARDAVRRLRDHPVIRERIQDAMDTEGLTVNRAVREHKRLMFRSMNAFKPKMPDNECRRRSLDMYYKFADAYPSTKVDIKKTSIEARYDLNPDDAKRIKECTGENILEAEIIEEIEENEPL